MQPREIPWYFWTTATATGGSFELLRMEVSVSSAFPLGYMDVADRGRLSSCGTHRDTHRKTRQIEQTQECRCMYQDILLR